MSKSIKKDRIDELEVTGGVIQWDEGTIRFIDDYGNTQNVWESEDEGYDDYKSQYFPDHQCTVKKE